jgi:hypothetical protein
MTFFFFFDCSWCINQVGNSDDVRKSQDILCSTANLLAGHGTGGGNDCDGLIRLQREEMLRLLRGQDDVLVNTLLCILRLYDHFHIIESSNDKLLSEANFDDSVVRVDAKITSAFLRQFHPHVIFLRFSQLLGHDHETLLDFLINENSASFLEYLIDYLKFACEPQVSSPPLSKDQQQEFVNLVLPALVRLRLSIERTSAAGAFPFSPRTLVARLESFEVVVESWEECL